jgi:hypothetical protein
MKRIATSRCAAILLTVIMGSCCSKGCVTVTSEHPGGLAAEASEDCLYLPTSGFDDPNANYLIKASQKLRSLASGASEVPVRVLVLRADGRTDLLTVLRREGGAWVAHAARLRSDIDDSPIIGEIAIDAGLGVKLRDGLVTEIHTARFIRYEGEAMGGSLYYLHAHEDGIGRMCAKMRTGIGGIRLREMMACVDEAVEGVLAGDGDMVGFKVRGALVRLQSLISASR